MKQALPFPNLSQPNFKSLRLFLPVTGLLIGTAFITFSGFSGREQPYRYPFNQVSQKDAVESLEQELAFYQQRIQQSPTDGLNQAAIAGTYLKLARATGESNWYLLAEQAAKRSLANLPFNNAGALLALAKVAEAQHDFDGSIKLTQQVLETNPTDEEAQALLVTAYLGKGQVTEAFTVADRLVGQLPTLGTYALRALANVAQGEDAAALKDFKRSLALEEPNQVGSSAWVRTLMGRFYASRGEPEQAEALYREALRLVPDYALATIQLAQLETRQGHYRAAANRYNKILINQNAANTLDHAALQGLAQVKQLQGDEAAAAELWQQAEMAFRLHQDLTTFGHRRELAQLLLARGDQEDLAEALDLMEAELEIRQDAETLNTYAWALMRSDRWSEAQTALQEAIALGTRDAVIAYRAGLVEQQLGNQAEADRYFQQATEIDPAFSQRDRQIWGLIEQ
ncbi:MAG: tetratricopeptide repeat protein [Leptolyngbya sp. SIO4C5]|nr:tetratricopeptide repeat protein [Leptolyngbya sp. SIO4C5]